MGNCQDCQHWRHIVNVGNEKYTECGIVDWLEPNDAVPIDGFAIYANAPDDTGLRAGLKTGPLFGCTFFE